MRRSHEGSQAMQHSKQEVDLNSDILTLLEISGATKKCYPRKEGPSTIFRVARANHWKKKKTRDVSHLCGLAIYILKYVLKAKQELWKLKYNFTMQKKSSSKQILSKRKPKSLKILL